MILAANETFNLKHIDFLIAYDTFQYDLYL